MLIVANGNFRPVLLENKVILGSYTDKGVEVFRLMTLFVRRQISEKHYPGREELNWSELATHMNVNAIKTDDDKRSRNPISDDTLRGIDSGQGRTRKEQILELIGAMGRNPFNNDQPWSVYEMIAILREDRKAYPDFDKLREYLRNYLQKAGAMEESGVQALGRIVREAREVMGLSQAEFADFLNERIPIGAKVEDIQLLENPPSGYEPPAGLVAVIQSLKIVVNPSTGQPYDRGNELFLILGGKIDPNTGKPKGELNGAGV